MKLEKVSLECVFDALIDATAHGVYLFLFEVSSVCLLEYLSVNVLIEATGLNYLSLRNHFKSYRHMFTPSFLALQPPTTSDDMTSPRSRLPFIGSLFVLELNLIFH